MDDVIPKTVFVKQLRPWFLKNKRDLPWRKAPSPYHVWISEVMLQQTQVNVVIDYYNRWLKQFPTVQKLAEAPLEEVLKCWEGLGYYSRAKNLHKGAKYIVENFNGSLPEKKEELLQIPGLGPYTVGAIRSFAFHQRAAAVDGNVMRVLTRLHAIDENICTSKTQKKLWQMAEEMLPKEKPWEISEALIELGALICKKKPLCSSCPLKAHCKAYQTQTAENYPVKSKSIPITYLYRTVAVIQNGKKILIRKVPEGEIMGGLHEFPFIETPSEEDLVDAFFETFQIPLTPLKRLKPVKHSFTRFQVHLDPYIMVTKQSRTPSDYFWISLDEIRKLPFSSGHRKILDLLHTI